ncbi:MAG: molybdopterin-binding/glycosyltransferase family 2 protein [Pseudomonadota bacterium]
MKFAPLPLGEAEGALLAHSLSAGALRLKKGRRLGPPELAALAAAGIDTVVAARLEAGDVGEDEAAARIAHALAPEPEALSLSVAAPFTGRVNLYAGAPGVLRVDAARVAALNALDEAVTLATLPDYARLSPRQMVATVKIIPYAAPETAITAAERLADQAPLLRVCPPVLASASVIATETPGTKPSVTEKGLQAVRQRITALGMALADAQTVPHTAPEVAKAVAAATGEIVLILTASATSDRADVGPAGVEAAGGRLVRFGMPVDPGNLLFLAERAGRPVVGLPGCARSPKLNGADWVLERLVAGLPVDGAQIAAMGVGGLLKEIPARPAPRAGGWAEALPRRPRIAAVVLAAGAARRMRGADKLLEPIAGTPLLTRVTTELARSGVEDIVAVLRPEDEARRRALATTPARLVINPRAEEGMGTSLAAGVAALPPETDAALVVMADMPEIAAPDIDRLIAAFDPEEDRAIVRATAADGTPGHPVLFGRRFFEALTALDGDRGAREVVREHPEFCVEVALPGRAALTDLDTPEAWAAWRAAAG